MNFLRSGGLIQNRTTGNALHTEAVSVRMSDVYVHFSMVGYGEIAQGVSL